MVFQKNFTFSHVAILDTHVSSKGPSKCRSDILLSEPVPVLIAHGVIYLDGYVRDLLGILGPLRDRIRVRRAAKIRRVGGPPCTKRFSSNRPPRLPTRQL